MTTPFPFQEKAVARIERFQGRCLLALEQGLGKTYTSLLWASHRPQVRPVVVVCPASLKWMWQAEARRHFGWRAEVLEGTRPKAFGLRGRPPLYVINYDVLHAWLEVLQGLNPQCVIADEIHFAANRGARRSQVLKLLCEGVPHVLGLSGTPLVSRPAELWHPLSIIKPDLYPSFWKFARRYCAPKQTPWGWDLRGASHLDELHATLKAKCMFRRRKSQVLTQLPPKRRVVVPIPISDRRQYSRAVHAFLDWLREKAPHKAARAAKAQQLVKLGYLKRLAGRLKLPAVMEWVDDFLAGGDEKLVLFAVHRKVIAKLKTRYGRACVVVDGSVTGRKRRLAVETFQADKRVRIFLGNIKAAGVGLTLTAASTVAFAEYPWVPGEVLQAEDRCHRIGTVNPVTCHYLVAQGTVEESLVSILQKKQRVLSHALDGKGQGDTLDVYDLLTQELVKGAK